MKVSIMMSLCSSEILLSLLGCGVFETVGIIVDAKNPYPAILAAAGVKDEFPVG